MLHVDLPTRSDLDRLRRHRGAASVSLYLATTTQTQDIGQARIQLGNLLKDAVAQLEAADTPKRTIWPLVEQVEDLQDDDAFWAHQARSLAVFVTPDRLRAFRLPNRLQDLVQVSDRFHLKPLLRAISAPQQAYVLALEENDVRLVEVSPDGPADVLRVPDLPRDAASAVGTANVNSRSYAQRKGGSEGQKVLLRAYARQVDAAIRPLLEGRGTPLILAATQPLAGIYRSVASTGELVEAGIDGSPAQMTPAQLAEAARPILDDLHAAELDTVRALFDARRGEGRATADLAMTARAATLGAVDTLLVDIDAVIPGTVDDDSGRIDLADDPSATTYGVADEIAARALAGGGKVIAVRRDDMPDGQPVAAVLRWAV